MIKKCKHIYEQVSSCAPHKCILCGHVAKELPITAKEYAEKLIAEEGITDSIQILNGLIKEMKKPDTISFIYDKQVVLSHFMKALYHVKKQYVETNV